MLTISAFAKSQNQISCENISIETWQYPFDTQKTCMLNGATSINNSSTNMSSAIDDSIKAMQFGFNKNIHFLPVDVCESFPALVVYHAYGCSISKLFNGNFRKLEKLEYLNLGSNRIERIFNNTFNDLTSLNLLILTRNRIKFLNGDVFRELQNVKGVWLDSNFCIDEIFDDSTRLAIMNDKVAELCGFNEKV